MKYTKKRNIYNKYLTRKNINNLKGGNHYEDDTFSIEFHYYHDINYDEYSMIVFNSPEELNNFFDTTEAKNITKLLLNNIGLSKLPPNIIKLDKLKYLEINNNQFNDTLHELSQLESLEYLYIQENQIINRTLFDDQENEKNITQFIPLMDKLKYLDLSINNIIILHENIYDNLPNLESLILNNNFVNISDNNLERFQHLTHLELIENDIKDDISKLFLLQQLEILNLSYNYINLVPETINNLTNIKEIYLNNNSLTTLPDISISSLLELNISYNYIDHLPKELIQKVINDELNIIINYKVDFYFLAQLLFNQFYIVAKEVITDFTREQLIYKLNKIIKIDTGMLLTVKENDYQDLKININMNDTIKVESEVDKTSIVKVPYVPNEEKYGEYKDIKLTDAINLAMSRQDISNIRKLNQLKTPKPGKDKEYILKEEIQQIQDYKTITIKEYLEQDKDNIVILYTKQNENNDYIVTKKSKITKLYQDYTKLFFPCLYSDTALNVRDNNLISNTIYLDLKSIGVEFLQGVFSFFCDISYFLESKKNQQVYTLLQNINNYKGFTSLDIFMNQNAVSSWHCQKGTMGSTSILLKANLTDITSDINLNQINLDYYKLQNDIYIYPNYQSMKQNRNEQLGNYYKGLIYYIEDDTILNIIEKENMNILNEFLSIKDIKNMTQINLFTKLKLTINLTNTQGLTDLKQLLENINNLNHKYKETNTTELIAGKKNKKHLSKNNNKKYHRITKHTKKYHKITKNNK